MHHFSKFIGASGNLIQPWKLNFNSLSMTQREIQRLIEAFLWEWNQLTPRAAELFVDYFGAQEFSDLTEHALLIHAFLLHHAKGVLPQDLAALVLTWNEISDS